MLGKLFKHEFRETAKPLIPLNLILVALTIIGCILLGSSFLQNDSLELLAFSSLIIYTLSIFALFIITMVYLTVRFYKTMYSSQGYLTHTLPVSAASIINTKILVASFWILVASGITFLSVLLLVRVAAGNEWNPSDFATMRNEMETVFGIGFPEMMLYIVLSIILSCFSMTLMVFASLAIGQLFGQHRIIAAIVTFIVFYIIQQMLSVIVLFILGIGNMDDLTAAETATIDLSSFYRCTFLTGIIGAVVFCIIFYITGHYITSKHLNLE